MSKRSKKQEVPENLKWEGESQLKFFAKRHDKRFGDVSILQNKRTNQKVMCKEKASGDMKQFGRDVNTARQRMSMQNQYLHKMLGWSTQTKKELCSTHHYVKMFYEYPESDLRNETAQRKKNKTIMSENELSNATSNALNGLDYLHAKKLSHGDIRPQLISANRVNSGNEANKFELLDRLADPSPLAKCQINNMMNNKELFMSPQLWKHINTKGKKKPPYNRQKNDLFALGMSVLSAGNQTSMKNCYKKGGKFDATALDNHLKNFGDKYGHNRSLTNVVRSLVTLDEAQRPDTTLMLQRGHQAPVVDEFKQNKFEEDVPYTGQQEVFVDEQPTMAFNEKRTHQVEEQPKMTFHNKQVNNVAKEVEKSHQKPVESQKVVEGDTFFSNPTPVYQPYQASNYVPAEKVEPAYIPTEVVEVVEEPREVVHQTPVQTTPVYQTPTYVNQTYEAPVQSTTTHVSSQPTPVYQTQTYVSSQPTPVYQTPTYVSTQPAPEYTYVESKPVTTTVLETPKKSYQSYTQSTPSTEYRSSQPTTMSDGSNITYGTPKVVRKYVDHSSRRSFRGEDNSTTFTVQKTPHVETIVNTSPVYQQETVKTNFVSQPVTTTHVTNPTTTTRVVSNGDSYQSGTYVNSTPTTGYTVNKKKSTTFHDAQFDEVRNNVHTNVQTEGYTSSQSIPAEGRVITKKVTIRDSQGNIIKQYEEPV